MQAPSDGARDCSKRERKWKGLTLNSSTPKMELQLSRGNYMSIKGIKEQSDCLYPVFRMEVEIVVRQGVVGSAVEDWHTWGRMMYLLNRYEDGS